MSPPRTPPPASAVDKSATDKSAVDKSSPVGKVPPYYIQHKREQVQAFDKLVQQLDPFTEKQFLEYLMNVGDEPIPSKILHSSQNLSFDRFCSLANGIARRIKTKHFRQRDLLVFNYTEHQIPKGHVMGTNCRPDITVTSQKDLKMCASSRASGRASTNWEIIRLAGEKASANKSLSEQKKHAATYLHYLLLARPDLLVAQGLLITKTNIMFLVGIGGVGIKQLTVKWHDEALPKFLYAFIYRLYDPSHFADQSYTRTAFDEQTSQAIYNVQFKQNNYPNFRSIHARNPFATRTHVLSCPEHTEATVIKRTLCRTGRRFDEYTILSKIHEKVKVPGVVEVVDSHIDDPTDLCPGRQKHSLTLRQTGSPFTIIPTAKKVLETLFDLLEVLRFLRFERKILHRDISVGNVMYLEKPENFAQNGVEPLVFAKYLLGDSEVCHETSLLLVDFNLGEDLENKKDGRRMERTGTPIFISRAVEKGETVSLDRPDYVPEVPTSPQCYAEAHPKRIKDIPKEMKILVDPFDPRKQTNQSPDDRWRHELDHDVESVFWLLLYWAMVAQPEGAPGEYLHAPTWTSLLGDFTDRERLVIVLRSGSMPKQLTHSVYGPLWPLIRSLADILLVDGHWIPESNVRKRPEYICEAFQRLILQFIVENRDKEFMTRRVGKSLRQAQGAALFQALPTTPSQEMDGSKRASIVTQPHLDSTMEEDNESTRMSE